LPSGSVWRSRPRIQVNVRLSEVDLRPQRKS
jgi:hypothetical protein